LGCSGYEVLFLRLENFGTHCRVCLYGSRLKEITRKFKKLPTILWNSEPFTVHYRITFKKPIMTKNSLLSIFFVFTQLYSFSQTCTGNFNFGLQQDVDDFLINNPTCTMIDGNVTILSTNISSPITNLDGLQNITAITGTLQINATSPQPFSMSGLSNLTSCGNLYIEDWNVASIDGASQVLDLTGLENLVTVQDIGLTADDIYDITPLNGVVNVHDIFISDIGTGDGYLNLINCFQGVISMNDFHLHGDGGTAFDLSGFDSCISANSIVITPSGGMSFGVLDVFHQLETCSQINFLDEVYVSDFCSGFDNLQSVLNVYMVVYSYGSGYFDFGSLQNLNSLLINGGVTAPLAAFNSLQTSGDIYIGGNFTSVNFPVLETVNGYFGISGYTNFTQSISTPMLLSVSGDFSVSQTDLTDLSFMSGIQSVGGNINIMNNSLLSDCAISLVCERIISAPEQLILNYNAIGCNTIEEVAAACSVSYVTGNIYADLDCDGVFNNSDVALTGVILHNEADVPVGETYANGTYRVNLADNSSTTISVQTPPGYVVPADYNFVTTNLDEVFANSDFPLCPIEGAHNVSVYGYTSAQPGPGFELQYKILVTNHLPSNENVSVSFDFSAMPGASFVSADGGVLTGTVVNFNIPILAFNTTTTLMVTLLTNASVPLGTVYQPVVSVQSLPTTIFDVYPSDNVFAWSLTVMGSFDPNDKQVNIPIVNYSEISSTDQITLDYTIRFQNTGTAEAINIRVDDILEEDLDITSFQMLNASHPFQLSFDENRKVEWLFENILLPDSNSNEPASHGFIHFRIKTKNNLQLTDVIENSVAIYFDYNEPVITNTATTSFYVCPAPVSISGVEAICQNEEVTLTASENWNTYSWTLNGNQVSSTNEFYSISLNVGSNELQLEATTDLCSSSTSFTVDVFPTPTTPVITQNGNTLTATGIGTYTWTLNGEVLSDTDSSIEITETGNYGVSYVDVCPSLPVSGLFEFVGVIEWKASERILISPNPTNDATTITLPSAWTGQNEITLYDAIGKAFIIEKISASKFTWQLSTLPKGCYQVLVTNTFSGASTSGKLMID
jgi:uncharacterized repeat protein (TIGR01451 family)